jgi:hypothetical protein
MEVVMVCHRHSPYICILTSPKEQQDEAPNEPGESADVETVTIPVNGGKGSLKALVEDLMDKRGQLPAKKRKKNKTMQALEKEKKDDTRGDRADYLVSMCWLRSDEETHRVLTGTCPRRD